MLIGGASPVSDATASATGFLSTELVLTLSELEEELVATSAGAEAGAGRGDGADAGDAVQEAPLSGFLAQLDPF